MEQALVFVSIVLGVAVAFELEHLHQLLRSPGIKWHWAQPLFALFVLLTIVSIWWMLAGREIEEPMTIGRFLPIMWVLVILNLLAAVSLPGKIPEEGIDLGQYYQDNCRYMWGLYVLLLLPLVGSWLVYSIEKAESLPEVIALVSGDVFGLAVFIYMFFVQRWPLVAFGYLGLAIIAANWLARSM